MFLTAAIVRPDEQRFAGDKFQTPGPACLNACTASGAQIVIHDG
jgi:hypothetical protein